MVLAPIFSAHEPQRHPQRHKIHPLCMEHPHGSPVRPRYIRYSGYIECGLWATENGCSGPSPVPSSSRHHTKLCNFVAYAELCIKMPRITSTLLADAETHYRCLDGSEAISAALHSITPVPGMSGCLGYSYAFFLKLTIDSPCKTTDSSVFPETTI